MKQGWELKNLVEVCLIKPPKKEAKLSLTDNAQVSFLPMEDLGILEKNVTAVKVKPLNEVFGKYTYFANDDLLLAKITPCFENGKLGIARKLTNGVGFGSSEYIVFRNKDNILIEFLFYYLSQEIFREEGRKNMTGAVGHKRVSKEFIENYRIPLPPLSEQQRIVSILDLCFTAIDKAKANAEQNLKNSKELFESNILKLYESKEWETKTLNQISENLDNKRIPITKNLRKSGDIPYYGASGIVDYVEDYLFDENLLCISEDGANLLARSYPIAFSISGKTWVNNHAHVLKFSNLITQKFVEVYINSIKIDDYVSGMAQPKLNQTFLNKIPIPMPSFEIQQAIVQLLNSLRADTQKLNAVYQKKIYDLEEVKKSILQKAFRGELTN